MTRTKSRKMTQFEYQAMQPDGLRFGDMIKICPPEGRSSELVLQRTAIYLQLHLGFDSLFEGISWSLPKYDYPSSTFKFELVRAEGVKAKWVEEEDSRYLLRAMGDVPFVLNGAPTFEAFIKRGDQILIGRHQISVQKKSHEFTPFSSFDFSEQLLESKLNILLTGETGTGKTHLARQIHEKSLRLGEFVHINLNSFSHNLIESELFGHVKGAFSGATQDKKGAFRQAHRGTLFIDEIDSLPIDIQTKLLLFLEDKKVRPVGSERTYDCDVRLIFASGRCLESMVSQNKMRADFYYRISSGAKFKLPPLRETPELIKSLCQSFGDKHQKWVTTPLLNHYLKQQWPGNIRQLLGHLEKKTVFTKGHWLHFCPLDEELLPKKALSLSLCEQEKLSSLEDLKNIYCQKVVDRMGGNVVMAAKLLKVAPNTIRKAIRAQAA